MLAFFLGIILGALGGLMFLVLLAEVVRKDELLESSELNRLARRKVSEGEAGQPSLARSSGESSAQQ